MTQMYHAITKHTHTHTHTLFFFFKEEGERENVARLHVSSCLIHCHLAQQQTNKQKKGGACGVSLCVCVCVCVQWGEKKKSKKECGPTISDGLSTDAHSQVRSHYCATRRLLPAVFPPWAGSSLLRQPGPSGLPPRAHIDAGLSVDTRSTWHAC